MPGLSAGRYDLPSGQGYTEVLPEDAPATGQVAGAAGLMARIDEQTRQRRELVGAEAEKSKLGLIPAKTDIQKDSRRQYLISQAAKHDVPQNVLANQIQLEGVEEVAAPTPEAVKPPSAAQIIETAEGIMQWNPSSQKFDIRVGAAPLKAKTGGAREQLANLKLSAAASKASKSEETRLTKAKIISAKSAKGLEQSGFFTTGFIGNVLSKVPGTGAYDLDKTVDTIKANLGFEELASMRASSPTGGALGQIAVRELEFLQRAMDALEQGQGQEQFEDALTAVKLHYDNVIKNIEEGRKIGAATFGEAGTAPAPEQADNTISAVNPATGQTEVWDTVTKRRVS